MFKTKYKVTKNKYLNTLKYKTFFAVIPQKTFMSKFLKNRQEVQVQYIHKLGKIERVFE